MSQITENTIVINKEDEQQLLNDYQRYKDTHHRIREFNRVYADERICIYVFDANGDTPWEIESDTLTPIALETRFSDWTWTRVNGNDFGWTLKRWLRKMIPEEKYKDVCNDIAYTF